METEDEKEKGKERREGKKKERKVATNINIFYRGLRLRETESI